VPNIIRVETFSRTTFRRFLPCACSGDMHSLRPEGKSITYVMGKSTSNLG